ncbi:type II restriction enzyme [Dysgonomonas sp. PFB1-18]|uniref:BsuBI/PstI family type II restriction endonuclease n=1 Tax=unclassified Dysgonomonas TaxID=2630389 RepID=UPI002476757C|nr:MULTISPECIES: BsuBI/PstI family type II restriction endonuclease [unclassified Dysgonomonas]MDH6309082.1 type II restriction enzyme [Dysgonomonas sp. PF1-14]MDH6338833.1 type II restriction enzyme [Dysgonomonas sp. PF1-16]MDH6380139.1 type II restriction enzyme [Dysgonomonas sp. PFB1-18]MDH6397469.1 type II restriction enzyme [Dysgonomonas sp. PF1-23]
MNLFVSKVDEAQEILKALGLPVAQQNEMSALTLLALCDIKEDSKWSDAIRQSMGVTKGVMTFVNENYKKAQPYAPNTRETFRRQVLHQLVQARVVDYNPDIPNLPVNSPRAHYAIGKEALEVIKSYGSAEWDDKLSNFISSVGKLSEIYDKAREMQMIPVIIEGEEYKLSAGKHNVIQAAVIEEFAPRFSPGAKVLYIGDTAKKDLYVDSKTLEEIGIPITEHSKLPDIVIYDKDKEWLFLIEVVTSHVPVSPKRVLEMEEFLSDCKIGKVYVTAFPDKAEFRKYVADIAWETEVWIADNPDHMIHFNGDRFIGPR